MNNNPNEGTHWRTGCKISHAGAEILPNGKDIEYIVISSIEYKPEGEMVNGQRKTNLWIAHFAENPYTQYPMILNVTNRKRLCKLFPECNDRPDLLRNVPVRLTREKARNPSEDGEMTWALRISKTPASKPKLAPFDTSDANLLASAVDYIKKGGSMDGIRQNYEVSAACEKIIMDAVNAAK